MRHWLTVGCLAIAACGGESAPRLDSAGGSVDSMAMPPAWAVPPNATNLTCSPSVLGSSDVLTMKLGQPHGSSFTAIGPDRTQYLVVFHGQGEPDRGRRRSLVQPDSFAHATELNLDPKVFTAAPWVVERDTNELLFRTPGYYRLIVGSDLETDGPSYAECVVRYAP